MKHAICFDCRFLQVKHRESNKSGANLEHIFNFAEVSILNLSALHRLKLVLLASCICTFAALDKK